LTILFVGAGASAPFGYPTMGGLNDKLHEMISGKEGDLLTELLPIFPKTAENDIEDVLQTIDLLDEISRRKIMTALQNATAQFSIFAKSHTMTFSELVALGRSLRERLEEAIFDVYQFRSEARLRLNLYEELLSTLNPFTTVRDYSIFTTNYDRIIEELCAAKGY
jgi:hypothetical protein